MAATVKIWNDHANQLNDWCPWSGKTAIGYDRCPAGCPTSQAIEGEPRDDDVRVGNAVNAGADFIIAELDLGDRDTDLVNLVANAIGTAWKRAGSMEDVEWEEFVAENWGDPPEDIDDRKSWDPKNWWDW